MRISTPVVCSPVATRKAYQVANDEHLPAGHPVDHDCGERSQDRERQQSDGQHDGDRRRVWLPLRREEHVRGECNLEDSVAGLDGDANRQQSPEVSVPPQLPETPKHSSPLGLVLAVLTRFAGELHPQPCGYFFTYSESLSFFIAWASSAILAVSTMSMLCPSPVVAKPEMGACSRSMSLPPSRSE